MGTSGDDEVDGILDKALAEAEERYEREARANAANVTAHRIRQFVLAHQPQLRDMIQRFAFMRGLTAHDVDVMLKQMEGNPYPIKIAPPPPDEE